MATVWKPLLNTNWAIKKQNTILDWVHAVKDSSTMFYYKIKRKWVNSKCTQIYSECIKILLGCSHALMVVWVALKYW